MKTRHVAPLALICAVLIGSVSGQSTYPASPDPAGGLRDADTTCADTLVGDVTQDGTITSADILNLVNFMFKGMTPTFCEGYGDANCSYSLTAADVIYLVNYVFKGGPPPCSVCDPMWQWIWYYC